MHLKTSLLAAIWPVIFNSKPGCRVSALQTFVKLIPPTAFGHQAQSETCFFQLLIPGLTHVSLLESKSEFEIDTQPVDTEKLPSSHLWSMA
jgi:hypothetical protein